jgi:hypothetical protein
MMDLFNNNAKDCVDRKRLDKMSFDDFSQFIFKASSKHISPFVDPENSNSYLDYTIKRDTIMNINGEEENRSKNKQI